VQGVLSCWARDSSVLTHICLSEVTLDIRSCEGLDSKLTFKSLRPSQLHYLFEKLTHLLSPSETLALRIRAEVYRSVWTDIKNVDNLEKKRGRISSFSSVSGFRFHLLPFFRGGILVPFGRMQGARIAIPSHFS